MSHVKAGGSAKNIHNNAGHRLGVKRFGGQKVNAGEVIVRQVGATKIAGPGTYTSRNFTIQSPHLYRQDSQAHPGYRRVDYLVYSIG